MAIWIETRGYWPLPGFVSIYSGGKWNSLHAKNNCLNGKKFTYSCRKAKLGGVIVLEALITKALPKKLYVWQDDTLKPEKAKKTLLSRWIGGLYSNANPSRVSQVKEFYDAIAPRYTYHTEPGRENQLAAIARLIPKGSRVLDASAGTCLFAKASSMRKPGLKITCMDLSEKMLEVGKWNLGNRDFVNVLAGRIGAMPFEDGSFDFAVHLFSNLLSQDRKSFTNFYRVLKRHGTFIYHPVKSPGEQWLGGWREKTRQRLEKAGFRTVHIKSIQSTGKKKSILTLFIATK